MSLLALRRSLHAVRQVRFSSSVPSAAAAQAQKAPAKKSGPPSQHVQTVRFPCVLLPSFSALCVYVCVCVRVRACVCVCVSLFLFPLSFSFLLAFFS